MADTATITVDIIEDDKVTDTLYNSNCSLNVVVNKPELTLLTRFDLVMLAIDWILTDIALIDFITIVGEKLGDIVGTDEGKGKVGE